MNSTSITIKGFTSKKQAIEFMNWYSGQGEQDIGDWMENSFLKTPYCKSIDEEKLIMEVYCYE